MSCCGEREKFGVAKNEQKWDYINLDDFHSKSCGTPLSYGFLWFLAIVSIGVYAVDLFTAANLLFFDRWSGQVQPAIPLHISRWVFAGCIILTWVLLAYRLWRAMRAIKSGVITKCYLDPLAVRIQSVHVGAGRGWSRFLVFAALTKGRKGAEYVALFTYFTFEAWLRICFAEGPRQVINALTLYSVLKAKLIPAGAHAPDHGHTPVVQFFVNIRILADQDKEQAAILFGMLYTLIIWIFSALSLILAFLFYILFLWHHIPSADGSLSKYCRRKIEKRLNRIVRETVDTALAKADKKRAANDLAKPGVAGTALSEVKRQPTLPILDEGSGVGAFPNTNEKATQNGFAPFQPRPGSRNTIRPSTPLSQEPTVPNVLPPAKRPGLPSRQTTQSSVNSNTSYTSDAPLMGQAAEMGYGGQGGSRSASRNNVNRMNSDFSASSHRPTPERNFSNQSHNTQHSQNPRMGPPRRQNTDMSASTAYSSRSQSRPPISNSSSFAVSSRRPVQTPPPDRRPIQEYEMQPPPLGSPLNNRPPPPPGPDAFVPYKPYNPGRPSAPVRNFTMPYTPPAPPIDYFGSSSNQPPRSGTAPVPQSGGYEAYNPRPPPRGLPPRAASAGPRPTQGAGPGSWANRGPPREW